VPKRDQQATNVSYYRRNRAFESRRVRIRQDATRDLLRERRSVPCLDLGGGFEPHRMDFDHRDPEAKSFRLTSGSAMLASAKRLEAEVRKCDVVCANCHRVRTMRRRATAPDDEPSKELERKRRYWRSRLRMLKRLKQRPCADCGGRLKQRPCADCGGRFPSCAMDFDHRDPAEKRDTISRMVGRAGTARIMAEVAKCDIV
jgi:hypothetical protein